MRVGILSTFDSRGGAARSALRLHNGLINFNIKSTMFVQAKDIDSNTIIGPQSKLEKLKIFLFSFLSNLPLGIYTERNKRTFSTGWLNSFNLNKYDKNFDIINLHWVANGFQSITSIKKINKPIVLSLHDSWYFTGGCHVPFNCKSYIEDCGACEVLNSSRKRDLSHRILKSKKKNWKNKPMVIVAASQWLADCARNSSLFKDKRIEVINPGLDLNMYKPYDKIIAREILGLSVTDNIILFGAISATTDFNKGFHLLIPALELIQNKIPNLKLVVFGASESDGNININIPIKYVGKLNDDISLSLLYSAADLMIVPSIQEAFGQTASESFACGTPVVSFRTSGLLDIIDHKVNGYLAEPFEPTDLAEGIFWVLSDKERLNVLSINAREKAVSNFGIQKCVEDYISIYKSILK
jgi:glycosyltransferase involved in cell wall biosynthesis